MAEEWQEFSIKKILEVKQRIQTVVTYEELRDDETVVKEAIVDSFDRPVQAMYT